MNTKHAAAPWRQAGYSGDILDAQNQRIAVADSGTCAENDEVNAERIVACVNALEGVANPAAVADVIKAALNLLTSIPIRGNSIAVDYDAGQLGRALTAMNKGER